VFFDVVLVVAGVIDIGVGVTHVLGVIDGVIDVCAVSVCCVWGVAGIRNGVHGSCYCGVVVAISVVDIVWCCGACLRCNLY